jgi:hypothetical protein
MAVTEWVPHELALQGRSGLSCENKHSSQGALSTLHTCAVVNHP